MIADFVVLFGFTGFHGLHFKVAHFKASGFHGLPAPKNNGNFVTVRGLKYELLQFHWHFASEHMVDGKVRFG